MGPVLLQGGPQGTQRPHPQEPAGVYRHEPDRLEPRALHSCGEYVCGVQVADARLGLELLYLVYFTDQFEKVNY